MNAIKIPFHDPDYERVYARKLAEAAERDAEEVRRRLARESDIRAPRAARQLFDGSELIDEIIELLDESREWMNAQDILDALSPPDAPVCSMMTLRRHLARAVERGLIEAKEHPRVEGRGATMIRHWRVVVEV